MVDLESIKKCYTEKEKLDEELIKQLNLIKDILGPVFLIKNLRTLFLESTISNNVSNVSDVVVHLVMILI